MFPPGEPCWPLGMGRTPPTLLVYDGSSTTIMSSRLSAPYPGPILVSGRSNNCQTCLLFMSHWRADRIQMQLFINRTSAGQEKRAQVLLLLYSNGNTGWSPSIQMIPPASRSQPAPMRVFTGPPQTWHYSGQRKQETELDQVRAVCLCCTVLRHYRGSQFGRPRSGRRRSAVTTNGQDEPTHRAGMEQH